MKGSVRGRIAVIGGSSDERNMILGKDLQNVLERGVVYEIVGDEFGLGNEITLRPVGEYALPKAGEGLYPNENSTASAQLEYGLHLITKEEIENNKPKRSTYDGRVIEYSNLSQQHLSNIIWFNKIFWNDDESPLEKEELNKRFEGKRLPYKPSKEFEDEIKYLEAIGCIKEKNGKELIWFDGAVIGEIVDNYE